jgi:biotin operon repressor
MKKSRGNATSKAARAERQARALQLLKEGKTQAAIAEELRISRQTFWRDLQAIEAHYVAGADADIKQFKEAQYRALMKLEEATAKGIIPPDVTNALTRIRDSVAKLLGLNAPIKSVSVSVNGADPKTLPLYRRFIHETRWVPEEKFERIWALCRELEELPGTRPTPGPPADSELWHDAEETLLTDGGTDETA